VEPPNDPQLAAPGRSLPPTLTSAQQTELEQLWLRSKEAWGTARGMERKKRDLEWKLQLLSYIGIATPLFVGVFAGTFGVVGKAWSAVLAVAGVVGVAQTMFSAWSAVAHWEKQLSFVSQSMADNDRLYQQFKALAERRDFEEIGRELPQLIVRDEMRRQNDLQNSAFSAQEKRFMHRSTLLQFQCKCATCGEVPTSLSPTNKTCCGDFPARWAS